MARSKKAPAKSYVSLPARNGVCETCGGRIHYYPAPGTTTTAPGGNWVHLDSNDWVDNPHVAAPKEVA